MQEVEVAGAERGNRLPVSRLGEADVLGRVEMLKGVVAKEHVHLLVSIPPQLSVSKLVQKLKGKTSYKLQRGYRSLQKVYWGQGMWARGYFACSTGNVSDEMIAAYIEHHSETEERVRVVDPGDFES